MKLSEKVDVFTGVISSGTTPALGPEASRSSCSRSSWTAARTFLFDKVVPQPHYISPHH